MKALLFAAWIGTWAAAPQPALPAVRTFQNETIRLIVHTSAGGSRVRVHFSNLYGDRPLVIGAAHIARRGSVAGIEQTSDRRLTFGGRSSIAIPARSSVVTDPVNLAVAPLSDLAISVFLPRATAATTSHVLAKQTNYLSTKGDHVADASFPISQTFRSWPFLTGVDVETAHGASVVAFGSSLTDGDGTAVDNNHRYPDILAERLQNRGRTDVGVLNEGLIGNRLLSDSPKKMTKYFGAALGEAGLKRFDRDVLSQPGVQWVIIGLGVNDILMPGEMAPASEAPAAEAIIAAYRQLIGRAHAKGVRVIGSTIPPFEDSFFKDPPMQFYTAEKESVRRKVNAWILNSGEFDAVVDFDSAVRDPDRPTRILPAYDSGDHLHPNDAGAIAQANVIPLELFSPPSPAR
ncbi:MAG TPA: SGNH/GDSL hydrolase family protein [Thermoanaerobaculia bacterium]|nr:SGNH/GDSL hydrolase family protein [Thermoanaerobaculia bacterium]